MKFTFSTFLIAALIVTTGCLRKRDYVPISKQKLKGSGIIYLIPLGDFPANQAEDLAVHLRSKYNIDVRTLPKVELLPVAVNEEREQLIAEQLVSLMKQARPELIDDPKAFLIGLTDEDMYIGHKDWQFAFNWREKGKYAVVSSGRMNLGTLWKTASDELVKTRMRKMVTKNVGLLYYNLELSNDPRSVLYGKVDGMKELDRMGEEF